MHEQEVGNVFFATKKVRPSSIIGVSHTGVQRNTSIVLLKVPSMPSSSMSPCTPPPIPHHWPPAKRPAEEGDWRVPKSSESAATATAAAAAAGGEEQSSPFQSPPQSRAGKDEWQCTACTFANPASRRKCSMCTMGSRPPGMGRSQPLSLRSPGDTNRDGEGEARGSSAGAQKKVRGAWFGGGGWG